MNIFNSIDSFLGDSGKAMPKVSVAEIFSIIRQIRTALGEENDYLDKYLSIMVTALNHPGSPNMVEDGFFKGNGLRGICTAVVRKKPEDTDHPFYVTAKNYIDSHPLEFDDKWTAIHLYYLALADEFTKLSIKEFTQQRFNSLSENADIIVLTTLYEKISEIIGTELIDKLNHLLKDRFIISPIILAFAQGLANDLLYTLDFQDEKSGKYTFQFTRELEGLLW